MIERRAAANRSASEGDLTMATLNRRQLLAAGTALGVAGTGFSLPVLAQSGRKSVTLALPRDVQPPFDPLNRLSFPEGNLLRVVLQGLIAFKPGSFEWELSAAKRIEQVSDTVIEFELKPGLQFHGGFGELTAADVKFSFERAIKPGADGKPVLYSTDFAALEEVEVTGTHSGRIRLKAPAPALWQVALPDISGLIISRKAYEAGAYRADQPTKVIGTGPYLLKEWRPNERVVLQANPEFQGPKPGFEEIILRPVRDSKTAELAFRADELQFTAIEPANAADIAKIPGAKILKQDSINFIWIGINVEKPPFNDPRVRRAIRLAIDVDQVIEGAYNGAVGRAYGPVAPGLLGNWKDAPRHARDVAAAKKLLAEAGVPALRAKLTLLNKPAYQNAGIIVQAQLAEAGITLDLDVQEGGSFWSAGNGEAGKTLELSLQRFGGKADPSFQLQWFTASQIGSWNWQSWNSPEYDALFAKAGGVTDPAERARLYIEAQKLIDESAAFIWLTHEVNVYALRDWLTPGILPNGDDQLYNRFSPA